MHAAVARWGENGGPRLSTGKEAEAPSEIG